MPILRLMSILEGVFGDCKSPLAAFLYRSVSCFGRLGSTCSSWHRLEFVGDHLAGEFFFPSSIAHFDSLVWTIF